MLQLHKQKHSDQRSDEASSLSVPGRSVNIFTTACLPWMTGTAINPLLRAHYLADPGIDRHVTLYVPWLNKSDQAIVYPQNVSFDTPEAQEQYVRDWVKQRTGQDTKNFSISWYPGRYAPEKGSILPVGDITKVRGLLELLHLLYCSRHVVRHSVLILSPCSFVV
jgi:digalactosyldiacylglycerol synthase